MRLSWCAAVVLAGCAKPPEPLKPQPPTDRSAVEMRERAKGMTPISREPTRLEPPRPTPEMLLSARPAFDPDPYLPDTGPILRWPLSASSHPELVPQFEIARALAEPGVGWTDLCRLGAHNRHAGPKLRDQIAYLRAWCAVGAHDINAAIGIFASLARSTVAGLVPAVRQDIVNVVVQESADDATRLLSRHQVRDLEVLDLLAATYYDLGKLEDAKAINELAIRRDDVNRGNRCRRQARRVMMNPDIYRSPVNSDLRLFDEPAGADRTCDRLEAELACWLRPGKDCGEHFKNAGIDPRLVPVLSAFSSWPTTNVGFHDWESVADRALAGGNHPLAYEFAVTALEQAARTVDCQTQYTRQLKQRTVVLRSRADRPTQFDDRLDVLVDEPDELCD